MGEEIAKIPGQLRTRLNPLLPPEQLHDWMLYDADTGILTWKNRMRRNGIKAGSEVGSLNDKGYRAFGFKGVRYSTSRVAWAMSYGYWPNALVDHIDGNRSNNRLSNLRLSTHAQNQRNSRTRRNGLKGAYPNGNRWRAVIELDHKAIHIGSFATEAEAHAAYCAEAVRLGGEFARFS